MPPHLSQAQAIIKPHNGALIIHHMSLLELRVLQKQGVQFRIEAYKTAGTQAERLA